MFSSPQAILIFRQANDVKSVTESLTFHKVSKFMFESLFKRMRLSAGRLSAIPEHYAGVSSALNQLAITREFLECLGKGKLKVILRGFGLGFSWEAMVLEFGQTPVQPLGRA